MLLELVTLVLVASYVLYRVSRKDILKYGSELPGDRPLPIIGNANMFLRVNSLQDLLKEFVDLADRYYEKGLARFWVGPYIGLILWEPSFMEVLANSPQTQYKSKLYYHFFGELSNGVFTDYGGPKWKELRKPINKSMAKKYLDNDYFEIFLRKIKLYCDNVEATELGTCVNALHNISSLTLDIFAGSHLGVNLNEIKEKKFDYMHWIDVFLESVIVGCLRHQYYLWRKVGRFSIYGKKVEEVRKGGQKLYDHIKEERKKSKEDRTGKPEYYADFLIRRAAEKSLSETDSLRELVDVIVAGADTLAITLSSGLLFLAMFPEIQEEAYREQVAIFGDSDRDPTPEDFSRMECLNRIHKEVLRIVCTGGVGKATGGEVRVGKYTIPRDSVIYIFLYYTHRDPKYWERPASFYPDHFLPEKEKARPRYAYMPFGVGIRGCPGMAYANNVSFTMYSMILRKFKLTTSMKFNDIEFTMQILMKSINGYPVKFEKR